MKSVIKKLVIAILALAIIFTIVGCSDKPDTGATNPTDKPSTSTESGNAPAQTSDIPAPSGEEPGETQQPVVEKTFKTVIGACKVDLLNIEYVPYDEAEINGYYVFSEDYEDATILTVGIRFPAENDVLYMYGYSVYPDSDTSDKAPVQTSYGTSWHNESYDYALIVIRVGGKVDPSKAVMLFKDNYSEDTVALSFENNGEPAGFDRAVEAFSGYSGWGKKSMEEYYGVPSAIVKLEGRYYKIVRRYTSIISGIGNETLSYVLVPLSGGLQQDESLAGKAIFHPAESVTDVKRTLKINENGKVDESTIDCQTTIELDHEYLVPDELITDDYNPAYYEYLDEHQEYIEGQMELDGEQSTVEFSDGDGNAVILKFN